MSQCPDMETPTRFWFKTPKFGPKFLAQSQIPPILIKYNSMKSECAISDELYESMPRYKLKPNFEPNLGIRLPNFGSRILG